MIVPKVYEPWTNTLQDSNKDRWRGAGPAAVGIKAGGCVCGTTPPGANLKLSTGGVAEKRADIAASGEIYTTHPFHPSFASGLESKVCGCMYIYLFLVCN